VQPEPDGRLQTMGWNYWYNWTIVLPAELSAAAILIDFWDKNTKLNSAWVTICLIVVIAINFMGAGMWISHGVL
jgi:yeast amino acid transporter